MKRSRCVIGLLLVVFLAACSRDPKEVARRYVDTGNKYFEKNKYKEASIMYRRALQRNARDPQAYYRLGLTQMKTGQIADAYRSMLRATDLDPNNMDALAKLGELDLLIYSYNPAQYKSQLKELSDVSKKLLAKNPQSYEGLRLSGLVDMGNRNYAAAIEKLNHANQVKPDQPELLYALVQALYQNKQADEAEQTAKRAIAERKAPEALYDLMYMQYAVANRPSDAEQVLKQKVANYPKSGNDLVQLAFHYFLARRPDDMNATLQKLTSDPKTFPQGHLLAGDLLMRIGQADRAYQEYRLGEKQDGANKLTYGKREVEALARQGKRAEAEQALAQLLKDNPKDTETVAMHATTLIASKDPRQAQKAIDELQPLVAVTPPSQKGALQALHFNLGRAYLVKGDPASLDQARLQFEETLKVNRDYAPAKLALAELLISHGESPRALQEADQVIKMMPRSLEANLVRTMALMNMGETRQARQELTAIVKAVPQSKDARYQLGLLDFSEKKYKDAEESFDALMKANDPRGFQGMVSCKAQEGEYDAAIQMVQAKIREQDKPELHRLLAELEMRASRPNNAIAEYQSIVQKQPTAYNYVRLGQLQQAAGQFGAAVAAFTKAAQVAPNEPAPLLSLAVLYDTSGRADEATKTYERVLKIQPDNPVALNNLAYSKAEQGVDLDQALTFAERAKQKLPNDPNVADTIALIYLRKNLVEDSVRVLSDLVAKDPARSLFHLHYAAALYQKGDKTGAAKELDLAVHTGPTDREKLRIQELRQKLS